MKIRVFPEAQVKHIREKISNPKLGVWKPGQQTAGEQIRHLKSNLQFAFNSSQAESGFLQMVSSSLMGNHDFVRYALPTGIHTCRISKYQPGDAYHLHCDSIYMTNMNGRADLSWTLFLSDPSEYEGGELVLGCDSQQAFKLEPGEAIVYPSGMDHQVLPIISGERLAIVGWSNSYVKEADKRFILWRAGKLLDNCCQAGEHDALKDENIFLGSFLHTSLLRLWGDSGFAKPQPIAEVPKRQTGIFNSNEYQSLVTDLLDKRQQEKKENLNGKAPEFVTADV
ncbi:MAG TPA: Fe2+-dependent dioxygenase [Kamptonema sp.]|nr:Fe2+-dependent dioxygenase [Kamptonema sp.]